MHSAPAPGVRRLYRDSLLGRRPPGLLLRLLLCDRKPRRDLRKPLSRLWARDDPADALHVPPPRLALHRDLAKAPRTRRGARAKEGAGPKPRDSREMARPWRRAAAAGETLPTATRQGARHHPAPEGSALSRWGRAAIHVPRLRAEGTPLAPGASRTRACPTSETPEGPSAPRLREAGGRGSDLLQGPDPSEPGLGRPVDQSGRHT